MARPRAPHGIQPSAERNPLWRTAGGRLSRWPTAPAFQRCLEARFAMRADRRQQLGQCCPRPSRLAPWCERGGVPGRGDHKDPCSKEACSKKRTCNIYTRSFNLHLRERQQRLPLQDWPAQPLETLYQSPTTLTIFETRMPTTMQPKPSAKKAGKVTKKKQQFCSDCLAKALSFNQNQNSANGKDKHLFTFHS